MKNNFRIRLQNIHQNTVYLFMRYLYLSTYPYLKFTYYVSSLKHLSMQELCRSAFPLTWRLTICLFIRYVLILRVFCLRWLLAFLFKFYFTADEVPLFSMEAQLFCSNGVTDVIKVLMKFIALKYTHIYLILIRGYRCITTEK